MRVLLAVLSSNSGIYFDSKYTIVYYISLNSQLEEALEPHVQQFPYLSFIINWNIQIQTKIMKITYV